MNKKMTEEREISKSKRIIAATLLFSYLTLITPFPLIAENSNSHIATALSLQEEKSEFLITAKEGGTVTLGEASIEIPEGALKEDTKISITRIRNVEPTGDSLYNAIPHSGGYRFLPAGTKFEKEVVITLPYNPELNLKPQSLDELYTYFYDKEKKSWIKLERLEVDQKQNKVRSLSTHFTDMINATLTMPESASPVDINLNSIKNLEAAKPDTHLIKFNPPKANNIGDASFSFELGIPAGRKGMQPQVSVSYSSGSGNGIMGKGFDINYGSSITTDTRFGLPKYDGNDSYLLDGVVLETNEKIRQGKNRITYIPLKQSSYERIIHFFNTDGSENYWEVTDKTGTIRRYGAYKNVFQQQNNSCLGNGNEVFSWNITEIVDVHGNNILYLYDKDDTEEKELYESYVYPEYIYYTGFEHEKGNYIVKFEYNLDEDGNSFNRSDVRIEGRTHKIVECNRLLTGISIQYKEIVSSNAIRNYKFTYKNDIAFAKESFLTKFTIANKAGEFYEYNFDYNDKKSLNGKFFDSQTLWDTDDNIQVSKSTSSGTDYSFSSGVGYGTNCFDVRGAYGRTGSFGTGENYTEETMFDINGDGRPDYVWQKSGGIYYKLNTGNGFGKEEKISINISKFDFEDTSFNSTGWNAYGGVGINARTISPSLGVGYSVVEQDTTSDLRCSFMDMDRDGLVDIIESSRNYYWHNDAKNGSITFSKSFYDSYINVENVIRKLSEAEKESYKKTYYMQTPFRMWKTPYSGSVELNDTFISNSSTVFPKIFIGNKNLNGGNRHSFDVKSNQNIYFVTDISDGEPDGKNIKWNISIDYKDAQIFENNIPYAELDLNRINASIKRTNSDLFNLYTSTWEKDLYRIIDGKAQLSSFKKGTSEDDGEYKFLEKMYKEYIELKKELNDLFNNNTEITSLYKFIINPESDSSMKKIKDYGFEFINTDVCDIDEVLNGYTELLHKGYFYPVYYDKESFENYLAELKLQKNYPSSDFNNAEYYEKFTKNFIYYGYMNEGKGAFILTLRGGDLEKFYMNYPISEELKNELLSLYKIDDIRAYFIPESDTVTKVIYYDQKKIEDESIERSQIKKGTEFNDGYIYVTDCISDTDYKKVYLDINENNLVLEDGSIFMEGTLFTDDKNNITFRAEDEKYSYQLKLSDCDYKSGSLSESEMKMIYEKYKVSEEQLSDEFWTGWENVKDCDVDSKFESLKFNIGTSDRQILLEKLFVKEPVYSETGDAEQEQQTLDYYVYTFRPLESISDVDYKLCQKIVSDCAFEYFLINEFDYYERNPIYGYILKQEWRDDDVLNIHKDKENKLLEICKEFNLAKFHSISLSIIYKQDASYTINKSNDEESFYEIMLLDENSNFVTTKKKFIKNGWNSEQDFETESFTNPYEICKYTTVNKISDYFEVDEKIKDDSYIDDIEVETSIAITGSDFLYGGKNNWFYGILKGTLDELLADNNLSFEDKLIEFNSISSEDDFNEKKDALKKSQTNSSDFTEPENIEGKNICFYLPENNIDFPLNESLSNKNIKYKNKSTNIDFKKGEMLIGSVSIDNEMSDENPDTILCYMPYISGDIIHADRVGGNTYYNIEGIIENDTSHDANFMLPNIRRTFTEGTDKTPNISASVGGTAEKFPEITKEDFLEQLKKQAEEIAESEDNHLGINVSLGYSQGDNKSISVVKQNIQDINGDGIPDILCVKNDGTYVYYGRFNEHGIGFENEVKLFNNSEISKNKTETDVYGASIGSSGNVTVIPKSCGKKVSLMQNTSLNPSGGKTLTLGASKQYSGFTDINGDGLPDYVSDGNVNLNLGNNFTDYNFENNSNKLTESSADSFSKNYSFSIGSGGSFNIQANSLASGVSTGGGVSFSSSSNNIKQMYLDINGDGLIDRVSMDPGKEEIKVNFNLGNRFDAKESTIKLDNWDFDLFENIDMCQIDCDSGYDMGKVDKLPIIGSCVSKTIKDVSFNFFGVFANKFANSLEWSTSSTFGINGAAGANVNFGIRIFCPLYVGTINITGNGSAGINYSTTINGISVRMMDIDGDGQFDHVLHIPEGKTYWKRNLTGKIGLLKTVCLPQGGKCSIDYTESYGTPQNPNFKYVMSAVTIDDGTDGTGKLPHIDQGKHSVKILYEYKNGYYDREKKDFYGYEEVITTYADKTYQTDNYYNKDYYSKGCLRTTCLRTEDNVVLSESETKLCDSPLALPAEEKMYSYEKNTGEYILSINTYEYDDYGNCTKIVQRYGDGIFLEANITYDNLNTDDYIIGLPVDIEVISSDGQTIRHRAGEYTTEGQLKNLKQYYDQYNYSENILSYDKYGNISSIRDSLGATLEYSYDGEEHIFVTDISQFGSGTDIYTSHIEYDYSTQCKIFERDCNGNTLNYKYDDWQRIKKIWTSNDIEENPAVSYEYFTPRINAENNADDNALWYAVTNNKVTFDRKDSSIIQTIIQIDGIGRAVRTAKTGCVNGESGWNVSGAVEYDEKGRIIKEGMTEFINGDIEALFNSVPKMTKLFTSYEYDEKDRQIKTILPDGSCQNAEFEIKNGCLISYNTDPLGNVSIQETDSRGNIIRVGKKDSAGELLTEVTYSYNEMGEMLKALDAKGHPVIVEYDLMGRRTAIESVDSGRQEFFYDRSSNLIRENNSVLKKNNKQIIYEYDGLNRLIKVDYPDTEDTVYTYGKISDSTIGAAGKILKITDASGSISYEYGKLGEVVKEIRTLNTHISSLDKTKQAVMEYQSDYLGRMQWIIYPDGEKISYGYDCGGQVVSVTGNHYEEDFPYVTNILYDQYGQRTFIEYGNGVTTEYKYDPARRWLDSIKTQNKWKQSYQNIKYSFDAVGNVLGYENDCLDSVSGNYMTSQTYSYDNLYQLIKVEGKTTYNPYKSTVPDFISDYTQMFTFDGEGLGNMVSKVSSETVTPQKSIGDNLNYNIDYVYDENYAHRLINAGSRYYKYDENGNIICEQDGSFENSDTDVSYHKISQESEDVYSSDYGWGLYREENSHNGTSQSKYSRTYTWNEKNLLISSVDLNYSTAYVYGQDGQRSNKYTQSSETLYFNNMWTWHTDSGNNIYGGQTAKNIYLGETRIVTKLNSGNNPSYQEEYYKQYYYHSDHLGSASLISDYKGDEYQRIEYTPYGETWVEKTQNTGLEYLPYKFTAKEMDEETGLYYYGARYLDPKYSMWISTDPALGEYIPKAPINEEAKKYNQNLPGMGGIFNHINGNLYHYAGNNPVRYIDPDGRQDLFYYIKIEGQKNPNGGKTYFSFTVFYSNNKNELNKHRNKEYSRFSLDEKMSVDTSSFTESDELIDKNNHGQTNSLRKVIVLSKIDEENLNFDIQNDDTSVKVTDRIEIPYDGSPRKTIDTINSYLDSLKTENTKKEENQ